MILFYDADGEIVQIDVRTLVNSDSYAADGYLVVEPGGKVALPEGAAGAFALDELTQPVLAEAVLLDHYAEGGRYYVDAAVSPAALMEVT